MVTARLRRVAALVLATTVLLSAVVAGGGVALAQEASTGAAEEAYVTDDGDVVAVMTGDAGTSDANAEYGIDLAGGLGYLLVESENAGDGTVTGNLTAAATRSAISASGNLTVPRPEALESLSFDLGAVTSEQRSTFDMTLSSTIASPGSLGTVLRSASTEGSITMGADRLEAEGQFEVASAMGVGGEDLSTSFTVHEQDGSYTVDVSQDRAVAETAADQWRSREAVARRLQRQFTTIAMGLGGEASVTIDRYRFRETGSGQYRLDVAYTATLSNVEERVEEMVARQLVRSGDLSRDQARRVAADLRAVTVEEASVSFQTDDGSASGRFTLDVANYGDLLVTYFEVADDLGAAGTTFQGLERAKKTFQAQRAAGSASQLDWQGSLEGGEQVTVDAEVHQEVTNWGAYVDELEARDVPTFATRYSLEATTSGDDLRVSGASSYSGDRIVTRFVNQLLNASDLPERSASVLRGFKRADLRKAKLQASLDRSVRVEAGAKFDEPGVFEAALDGVPALPAFSTMVGRTEAGQTNHYLRLDGAVSADASESAVRELALVGPETTVHMPGTWDREFPSMDAERSRDFLDLGEGVDTGATASGSGPGFGAIAGLVGLLAVALLAARRDG